MYLEVLKEDVQEVGARDCEVFDPRVFVNPLHSDPG